MNFSSDATPFAYIYTFYVDTTTHDVYAFQKEGSDEIIVLKNGIEEVSYDNDYFAIPDACLTSETQ